MRNVYVVKIVDEQAFKDAAQRRLALTGEPTMFHLHAHSEPCETHEEMPDHSMRVTRDHYLIEPEDNENGE